MPAPSALDPATLNREIARLETEAARVKIERRAAARQVARLTRRGRYLRLARWFRSPAQSIAHYPLAVFAIGPLVTGVVAFVLASLLVSNWSLPFGGFLIGAIAGALAAASLLYHPADELLPAEIAEAEAQSTVESARLQDLISATAQVDEQLATFLDQRRDAAMSGKLQRAMLLQRNWKTMRGSEWEDYIVEICRTLGANVQRGPVLDIAGRGAGTPASGPRGVVRHAPTTMFVTFSPRRIAVAAISEIDPFHTAAVQQVVHALAQQGCDSLGIITNARLTSGGKEFARSRRCTLIGEDEFPDFVLGKLSL
jgi:Restriction endonuclease